MLGRSQAHTLPTAAICTPVPDAEAVRQAALQASWRRDRAVARRRLIWRWLVWLVQRYYLYVLLLLALFMGWPHLKGWLASINPVPLNAPVSAPQQPLKSTPPPEPKPIDEAPATSSLTNQTPSEDSESPAVLRASTTLIPFTPDPEAMPAPPSLPPDTLPLKPENWLHSKEP